MQVTELESKDLKKSLKIVVDAARINAQMETELKAAGERIKIPGFRPGFIPMKILQQRYGKAVQADVLKEVINRTSSEAIAQKKLKPAMMPQINIEDYKDGGELAFTMTFEVFPDVPEMEFSGITLDRNIFDIDAAEIDKAAQRIADANPKLSRVEDGKAQSGNVVSIDFKGMIDGVVFDGGTAKDFKLELGSGQFIAGFEDQLIGAKEGDDRIVKVTFPKDYPGEKVAGKEASFAVTVKEIHAKETPAIDDEFAKTLGFSDAAGLREAIRGQMTKEYGQLVRSQLKKQLFDVLDEKYDLPLPQGMVDMEFNSIWERLKEAQTKGEAPEDKSEAELKEEYQEISQRRVKLGLLLADIGTREKIQISREELGRAVMQQASAYPGQEKMIMDFYRKHPERLEELRGPILEEKAVDIILGKVKYKDSKVSLAELMEADRDEASGDSAKKKKPAKEKSPKASEISAEKPKKKKAAAE